MPKDQRGVTLWELLLGLLLLAVVSLLSVPSLNGMLERQRLDAATGRLWHVLWLARHRAIADNTPVIVCAMRDGRACSGAAWRDGMVILFADSNGNGRSDAGEWRLQLPADWRRGCALRASRTLGEGVRYLPDGSLQRLDGAFQAGRIVLCNGAGGRHLILSRRGRLREERRRCE